MSSSQLQRKTNDTNTELHDSSSLSDVVEFTLDNQHLHIQMKELKNLSSLGEGSFSTVQLMEDNITKTKFAVKICHNVADNVMKEILNDMQIGKTVRSKFKIDYYGGLKKNFDVWILMEPMDMSVKDFYLKMLQVNNEYRFPGMILGYFSYCSVHALEDLHSHKIIHRDVKPSNMLVDKKGKFKLCDFGISGKLKDSLVQSAVGCCAYLSPERIDPKTHKDPFSIIADVWSLGVSIFEIAEMRFPFSNSTTLMAQLNEIVINPPPQLSLSSPYRTECPELVEFLGHCLVKSPKDRYRYTELKELKLISQFNDTKRFDEAQTLLSDLVKGLDLPL